MFLCKFPEAGLHKNSTYVEAELHLNGCDEKMVKKLAALGLKENLTLKTAAESNCAKKPSPSTVDLETGEKYVSQSKRLTIPNGF
jgi:hypothetical protein